MPAKQQRQDYSFHKEQNPVRTGVRQGTVGDGTRREGFPRTGRQHHQSAPLAFSQRLLEVHNGFKLTGSQTSSVKDWQSRVGIFDSEQFDQILWAGKG